MDHSWKSKDERATDARNGAVASVTVVSPAGLRSIWTLCRLSSHGHLFTGVPHAVCLTGRSCQGTMPAPSQIPAFAGAPRPKADHTSFHLPVHVLIWIRIRHLADVMTLWLQFYKSLFVHLFLKCVIGLVMSDSLWPHGLWLLENGILHARILEWISIPFSKGSSWPRDRTRVSRIAGRSFTIWATYDQIELIIY